MKKQLLIFPYGGNSLEAIACLHDEFNLLGFIDDDKKKQGKQKNNLRVFTRSALQKFPDTQILAVPGSPTTYLNRKMIIDSLKIQKRRFATIVHASASVSPLAKIGNNALIMAGVVITSDAAIGDHVCILPNTVIHHGVKIGDYVVIGSNVTIAGNTIIEENCYVGSGSSIINNVKIGKNSLVGLGSNVIHDVKSDSRVAGNPAKYI